MGDYLSANLARLMAADAEGHYSDVIAGVRESIDEDARGTLSNTWVKDWLGRRYRNIFLTEAAQDPKALETAKADDADLAVNEVRKRLASRFLAQPNPLETSAEMPAAPDLTVRDTSILFAPGLLTGLLPDLAFADVWNPIVDRFGVDIIASDSHPFRGSSANADDLAAALVQGIGNDKDSVYRDASTGVPPKNRVVMIGYSKGGPDMVTFLVERPELADRVKAVVGWAPAWQGSPAADDIYATKDLLVGDLYEKLVKILQLFTPGLPGPAASRLEYRKDEYDINTALRDLTKEYRGQWWAENRDALDALDIPFFSFAGKTSVSEVPLYQMNSVIALNKIDERNDMQVLYPDTVLDLPMATPLALFRAHHWDLSYEAFPLPPHLTPVGKLAGKVVNINTGHKFPRVAAVSSIILTLNEIGLFD